MADTEYKFNLRNKTNDGWVNVLTDANIVVNDVNGYFTGNRLDEVLDEIYLSLGGGTPGGPIHITDTTDSTGSTDELASFSTRGGASIAKNLFTGGLGIDDNLIKLNLALTADPAAGMVSGIQINRGGVTYDDYYILFDQDTSTVRIGDSPDGIDFSNLQPLATREDTPLDGGYAIWSDTEKRFNTVANTSASSIWNDSTNGQTLETGKKYLADNTVLTLTLPLAPVHGETISIHDESGVWFDNPLNLDPNGNLVMGVSENLMLNVNNATADLVYTTSQGWQIV